MFNLLGNSKILIKFTILTTYFLYLKQMITSSFPVIFPEGGLWQTSAFLETL